MGEEGTNKPTHDPSWCVWKHGHWECLHAIDTDHFWYGDVMVDLVALKYERDSLNAQTAREKWWDIHGRNSAFYMLDVYARCLAAGKNLDLATPENVTRFLREANKYGLHTGVKFD